MDNRIPLPEFFFLVGAGEVDRLAMLDYLEKATNNYQPDRLKIVYDELFIHIGVQREEIEDSLKGKIKEKMNEYAQQGKELPIKEIKVLTKSTIEVIRVLDKEKLLDNEIGFRMYPLYELRNLVRTKLEQSLKTTPSPLPHNADSAGPEESLPKEPGIEQFFNKEGLIHLPVLKNLYKNRKSKGDYIKMLFALQTLGLLSIEPNDIGVTAYHNALEATFGKGVVGERANVEYHFKQAGTHLFQSKVNTERVRIQEAIKKSSIENP